MSKHRKPSSTKKNVQRAATATTGAFAVVAVTGATAQAHEVSEPEPVVESTPVAEVAEVVAPTPVARTHTVAKGDWLSKIAPLYGLSTQELYQLNKETIGDNPNVIEPGQVFFVGGIVLPTPPVEVPTPSAETVVEVVESVAKTALVPGAVFTSGFGPRWGRFHAGIDLGAPIGTPIFTPVAGVVEFSGVKNPNGYGAVVDLVTEAGERLRFAHINAWHVFAGQRVEAGQHIADVGNRGWSTGPHLHFEVSVGPGPINPIPWLEAKGIPLS